MEFPSVLDAEREERRREEREDRRRSSSRAAWIVVFSIAVLLVLAGGFYLLSNLGDDGTTAQEVTTVAVPDLVGQTEADATDLIVDAGLTPSEDEEFNAAVEEGLVIRSEPAGGSSVAPGSRVNIVVSEGPANVQVPDNLVNLTESSAREVLEAANLTGGEVEGENSATVDEGRVIRTSPEAGTTAPVDSAVDLWLSNGEVSVPLLTDLTVAQAEQLLNDPSVQLPYRVELEDNSVVTPGIITAQSRPALSSVDQGTEIVLTVARAPAEEPAPETPAPSGAPGSPAPESPIPEDPVPADPAPGEGDAGEGDTGGDTGGNDNGNGNGGGNGNGNGSNTRPTQGAD